MATITSVSMSVAPEAAAHVIKLGLQREFEQMLDYTKQSVTGLRAINVVLAHDPECIEEPRIILEATRAEPDGEYDPTQWDWNTWAISTFPPEVFHHFVLMTVYDSNDGR